METTNYCRFLESTVDEIVNENIFSLKSQPHLVEEKK